MNKTFEIIATALIELKQASKSANNENEFKSLMKKYNMMFLGEHLNVIYTHELLPLLTSTFNLVISNAELLAVIPTICESLNMKYEALKLVADIDNPNPYSFSITLY